MQGDFTRFTHDPAKGYVGVLRQQGRLDLDADGNENLFIRERIDRLTRVDVIGPSGAPESGGGFVIGITPDGDDLTISAGRAYVDGILCELHEAATYSSQPHWLTPDLLTGGANGQRDLVYLDVWQRHVSSVEDPDLLDPALNGLDTTTRLQTVWQVRVLQNIGNASCNNVPTFPPSAPTGTLTIDTIATPAEADACDVVVAGGYRGVENRLYRVEIHDSGALGTATWKWSRDNGSVVLAIEEFFNAPPSQLRLRHLGRDAILTLRQDDWVEILDNASELDGSPGFIAQVVTVDPATRVLTLDRDIPAGMFDEHSHPRVRRWDQEFDVDADGVLTTGAGPFELEDGITVSFGGTDFRSGDWWAFAARTAGGMVDERSNALPDGTRHHYAPLARIQWSDDGDGTFTATVFDQCLETFPPLTGICAEDVCFDDSNCQLSGATNVQEALDALCAARDLRFHNKHLHGWGIVCGLQVHCGPEDDGRRRNVTVQTGYAIDCDGSDIIVQRPVVVDLLDRIAALDQLTSNNPILNAEGDGEVCLVLERAPGTNGNGGASIAVEPLGEIQPFTSRVLENTIWKDVFEGCIQSIVEFFRSELGSEANTPGAQAQLVGAAQRRVTTLLNLLIQLINPSNGRYVFLSAREDQILREFYFGLRILLQSKTFCAMFAGARPFPEYPFRQESVSTAFGKGFQTRLRIDARGERGYAVGSHERIHVYDLAREEMIADLAFPGGAGVVVRDVAVSTDGRRLFAIGKLNSDTIFVVADIDGDRYTFRPATIMCDIDLITLQVVPNAPNVYAAGRGTGLYEINPDAVQERPVPFASFNAVGHLVIPRAGGPAWATAAAQGASNSKYDRVLRISLDGRSTATYSLANTAGGQRFGEDDIAVMHTSERVGDKLYVVVDPMAGRNNNKAILVFNANPDQSGGAPIATVPVENTRISLGVVPGFLAMAFEDSYRVGLLDETTNQPVSLPGSHSLFRHSVQIAPRSIAVHNNTERAYVLNYSSNTISTVPLRYLQPENQLDLDALAQYRDDVIEAFADLLGGFLQYLKDCFCDRLLVDCPSCDSEDRIYLACASIRNGQVYQVCNFSKRKYVKTFPTVEYWLSLVPVIPLVREAVRSFCCTVLPDFFGRFNAPQGQTTNNMAVQPNRLMGMQMEQGVNSVRSVSNAGILRDLGSRFSVLKALGGDWFAAAGAQKTAGISPAPRTNEIVGQRTDAAVQNLESTGVIVAGVEAYDSSKAGANFLAFATSGGRIPTDRPVTLFEEDGIVKYYSVAASPIGTGEEHVAALNDVLRQTRAATEEITTLRRQLEETRRTADEALASRDREIANLRTSMERDLNDLRSLRTEFDTFRRTRPSG